MATGSSGCHVVDKVDSFDAFDRGILDCAMERFWVCRICFGELISGTMLSCVLGSNSPRAWVAWTRDWGIPQECP